ncbi:hypothetical protein HF519_19385 [Pseudonocardia bannensis]|uniref:MEDS domain-containing protein n=2 Tax=Pseudonocardia bannensis TaxID=630973 RepID=A0A848DME6_9PSEU|nr:hypothetical protein [Pseudonocardia bannensis]
MSWIRPPTRPAFPADLLSYEARVTGWLRAYPLIGVCMYDVDVFDGRVVIPVVKGHPKVWLDGQLIDNPYHLRPEQYEAASSVAHELLREVD